jgi:hypothetical protein
MDQKIIKEHPEYLKMFLYIQPYFINNNINNNPILKDYPILKKILKEYILKYNDLKQYPIFEYSKYKDKVNQKPIIY